jgi:hypothetical protein
VYQVTDGTGKSTTVTTDASSNYSLPSQLVGLNLAKAEISAKQGYLGKDPGEYVTQQEAGCPISQLVPS